MVQTSQTSKTFSTMFQYLHLGRRVFAHILNSCVIRGMYRAQSSGTAIALVKSSGNSNRIFKCSHASYLPASSEMPNPITKRLKRWIQFFNNPHNKVKLDRSNMKLTTQTINFINLCYPTCCYDTVHQIDITKMLRSILPML